MGQPQDLVLFTGSFPYDGSEGVLATELEIISSRFKRIFIVPSQPGKTPGPLPENARVVDLGLSRAWPRRTKCRALMRTATLAVAWSVLRQPSNWRSYASHLKTFLDILATSSVKSNRIRHWVEANRLKKAIFYDYWFENSTLALAILRHGGAISCAVARAHGFDVYDFRWPVLGRVPFREFKARHLDAVFVVSDDGARYMRRRVLRADRKKIHLSPLGVALPERYACGSAAPPLVVSCSSMVALKQVASIPAVLGALSAPIHWVHFGDGPERGSVESATASLPPHITHELAGWVDNGRIRAFYESHPVSAFLSLSVSEGVPVSMMEAQSFGVPIVALAVGGVAELVRPGTGIALPANASAATIADALRTVLASGRFDRATIREQFQGRYGAARNYARFADAVYSTSATASATNR